MGFIFHNSYVIPGCVFSTEISRQSSAADGKARQTRLQKFNGHHHRLVECYEILISQMPMLFSRFLSSITVKTFTGLVTREMSYKKQELITLPEHQGSPLILLVVSMLIIFFYFCVFGFCFIYLRSVYCAQCCWRHWIVQSLLSIRFFLTFMELRSTLFTEFLQQTSNVLRKQYRNNKVTKETSTNKLVLSFLNILFNLLFNEI